MRIVLLVLALQGVIGDGRAHGYRWDWAKPNEAPTRTSWVVTEAETARGCFVMATWFNDRVVEIRCPAFNPYGVTWQRYCVVKEGERLKRATVIIIPRDGDRQLLTCEVVPETVK